MNNVQQAALATANWWADQVFGGTAASNGDPDGTSFLLSILSGAQGVPADASKRDQFVAKLVKYVVGQIGNDNDRYGCSLRTDYGPEGVLADLASELKIGGSFPWKTMTWTYSDHFVVALGYGADSVLTWTADDYVRPACAQGQWSDGEDFHRLPWKCSAPKYHASNKHIFNEPDPLCHAPHPYIEDKLCLSPMNHDDHRFDDAYTRKSAHKFVPARQTSDT